MARCSLPSLPYCSVWLVRVGFQIRSFGILFLCGALWLLTAVCDLLRICLNGLEHIYRDRELHPAAVGVAELYLKC
jgi:hypothetical protein